MRQRMPCTVREQDHVACVKTQGLSFAPAQPARAFGDEMKASRDRDKAEKVAAQGGHHALPGNLDEAAAFGEAILYTVRDVFPSSLLSNARALTGKIVVDCNNSDMPADFRFATPIPSLTEKL